MLASKIIVVACSNAFNRLHQVAAVGREQHGLLVVLLVGYESFADHLFVADFLERYVVGIAGNRPGTAVVGHIHHGRRLEQTQSLFG